MPFNFFLVKVEEFVSSSNVYHFHPIAFVEQMNRMRGIVLRKGDKGKDKGKIIQEINIRLAGFGGNVPDEDFTERTEKTVIQFQKDYMKLNNPTGIVDKQTFEAIDEFSEKYDISAEFWNRMKCRCGTKGQTVGNTLGKIFVIGNCTKTHEKEKNTCDGFGDGTSKGKYKKNVVSESVHLYEYPGIHRSLLFGLKALQFYLSEQTVYRLVDINSGYRCRFKNYNTTNHMGKALDLSVSKNGLTIAGKILSNIPILRKIRDDFFINKLGAQKEWPNKNLFSIERINLEYYSTGEVRYDRSFCWIHFDVREFNKKYLADEFFCKNAKELNDKKIKECVD